MASAQAARMWKYCIFRDQRMQILLQVGGTPLQISLGAPRASIDGRSDRGLCNQVRDTDHKLGLQAHMLVSLYINRLFAHASLPPIYPLSRKLPNVQSPAQNSLDFSFIHPICQSPRFSLIQAHGNTLVGLCNHQNRDNHTIETQYFGKNKNENHSDVESRLLGTRSHCVDRSARMRSIIVAAKKFGRHTTVSSTDCSDVSLLNTYHRHPQ